jgi:hypothetical protein
LVGDENLSVIKMHGATIKIRKNIIQIKHVSSKIREKLNY